MDICHFEEVDKCNIAAVFLEDRKHRASLTIPLLNRSSGKTICVVGQNPSKANEVVADKTLYYIERFVYLKLPQYSRLIMLNLYSRIDTNKVHSIGLNRDAERLYLSCVEKNNDFLIVYGKLVNQGAYNFVEKAKRLRDMLRGKHVMKIDAGLPYAPHPGNRNIWYGNFCFGVTEYDFSDIK